MVAVKAAEAPRFLKSPPQNLSAYLLFGTDPGQITERAQRLAKLLAERESPPGEVLRLDDTDLDEDSGRLAVELQTRPMFSGRKIIRAATGRRLNAALLKPIIEAAPLEGVLIVEAGNLKADDSLRTLFERAAHTVAIGCYADSDADLGSLVTEVLTPFGLTIEPGARTALIARLGADRALSRAEIEKLALYALDRKTITEDDVDAIVGDAADLQLERIAEAAAAGRASAAVTDLGRALASGDDAQAVILITQRYFMKLHRVRSEIEQGARLDDALRSLRPPLHFKQRDVFSGLVRHWSTTSLNAALLRIGEAAQAARLSGTLDDTISERLILALAAMAKAPGQDADRHASARR